MALLTVTVTGMSPFDADTVTVNFQWFSNNQGSPVVAFGDSGSVDVDAAAAANVMNTAVIDAAAAASGVMGLTIAPADRKILLGGFN